jgi:hypothetical protein
MLVDAAGRHFSMSGQGILVPSVWVAGLVFRAVQRIAGETA